MLTFIQLLFYGLIFIYARCPAAKKIECHSDYFFASTCLSAFFQTFRLNTVCLPIIDIFKISSRITVNTQAVKKCFMIFIWRFMVSLFKFHYLPTKETIVGAANKTNLALIIHPITLLLIYAVPHQHYKVFRLL